MMTDDYLMVIAPGNDIEYAGRVTDTNNFKEFNEEKVFFYYNETDKTQLGIPLRKFMNSFQWSHLKDKPNWKLIISYVTDYYNAYDIWNWIEVLKKYNMEDHMHKVYIGALDVHFEKLLIDTFAKKNFPPPVTYKQQSWIAKICYLNLTNNPMPSKKFSFFSRNFKAERLDLYTRLHTHGLTNTKTSNFTFWNTNPYVEASTATQTLVYSKKQMLEKYKYYLDRYLLPKGSRHSNEDLDSFLSGVPHVMSDEKEAVKTLRNKWSVLMTQAIQDSFVHIVIESHFNHYSNEFIAFDKHSDPVSPMFAVQMDPEQIPNFTYEMFSPSFITEKTYKVLACKRPFIGFASAYYLKNLRDMGFKTFEPWIDESYDLQEDDEIRMSMIVKELARLNVRTTSGLRKILVEMEDVLEHNRQHLHTLNATHQLPEDIAWLDDRNYVMSPEYFQV
jgi:hypothetical protein